VTPKKRPALISWRMPDLTKMRYLIAVLILTIGAIGFNVAAVCFNYKVFLVQGDVTLIIVVNLVYLVTNVVLLGLELRRARKESLRELL